MKVTFGNLTFGTAIIQIFSISTQRLKKFTNKSIQSSYDASTGAEENWSRVFFQSILVISHCTSVFYHRVLRNKYSLRGQLLSIFFFLWYKVWNPRACFLRHVMMSVFKFSNVKVDLVWRPWELISKNSTNKTTIMKDGCLSILLFCLYYF